MNPLYNMLIGQQAVQPQASSQAYGQAFQNPLQKANYILQALKNPAAFVKQQFPDIPENISNDPNKILQYLQETRNISNDQISQIMNQFPRR